MEISYCSLCGKSIQRYKPTRLYKYEYQTSHYKQYSPTEHWNFCTLCYRKFEKWLEKNGVGNDEKVR